MKYCCCLFFCGCISCLFVYLFGLVFFCGYVCGFDGRFYNYWCGILVGLCMVIVLGKLFVELVNGLRWSVY